jgi:hypothetical protein
MVSMARMAVKVGARGPQHSSPRIDQGLVTNEKALLLLVEFLVGQNP